MFLARLLVNALALLAVFFLVWGIHGNDVLVAAIVMAVILALVNAFIRPIVILLTLPVSIVTFGVFTLFINAALFYLAAVVVNVHIDFWRGVLGWLVFAIISSALNQLAIVEW